VKTNLGIDETIGVGDITTQTLSEASAKEDGYRYNSNGDSADDESPCSPEEISVMRSTPPPCKSL
jgi:hypothetical protein